MSRTKRAALCTILFQTDLGRENAASYYRQGMTFIAMVTRWSRSMSNFNALIGQNLKGELIRKIYAASGNLFTEAVYLFTEADRISCCRLLMFLTVFFQWKYKAKYSCYQDSSVIHDWFVYWVFGPEMRRLSNSSEIQLRMLSFSLSHCSMRKRV